jgi:hypothetical protein
MWQCACLRSPLTFSKVNIIGCRPISGYWDITVHATCIDLGKFNMFQVSFNIFTDLVILLLPVPIVMGLKVNKRKKGSNLPDYAPSWPLIHNSHDPHNHLHWLYCRLRFGFAFVGCHKMDQLSRPAV